TLGLPADNNLHFNRRNHSKKDRGIERMIRIPNRPSIEVGSAELESIAVYCTILMTTFRKG
ncbi:MAG: hypothetical protein ACJ70P_01905, partial [Nitrososphaera sp.]